MIWLQANRYVPMNIAPVWAEGGDFGNPGDPQPPGNNTRRDQHQMRCPYCREEFQLPPGGIPQLRTCGSEYYDKVSQSASQNHQLKQFLEIKCLFKYSCFGVFKYPGCDTNACIHIHGGLVPKLYLFRDYEKY